MANSEGRVADTPLFASVVVNWNRAADTLNCLDSLHSARPRPKYVVVVDNASSDDSISRISGWARARGVTLTVVSSDSREEAADSAWLTVIRSDTNRGFAGGNNLGSSYVARRTAVTHCLLLNNDATIKTDFFAQIADALKTIPNSGLVTGTIYHDPDRARVWYAGGKEVPLRALVRHLYEVPPDGAPRQTQFVTGCAMVVSTELHRKIGLLPECYFPGYSEDAEYSRRARQAGFCVVYAPRAVAYHKVGATAGAAHISPAILQAQMRHRVYYVRRNFRGFERVAALSYLAATKPIKALVETLRGRPRLAFAILRGTSEGFFNRV